MKMILIDIGLPPWIRCNAEQRMIPMREAGFLSRNRFTGLKELDYERSGRR
jgi:hypothetical protein